MHGIFTIYMKEMEDHFSSMRFLIITALIVMIGVIIASMVGMGMQEELKGVAKPDFVFLLLFTSTGKLFSFVQLIGLLGPLIGIMIKGKLVAAGPIEELAKRGLGLEEGESYTLEEIYMKYFKEA